MASISTAPKLAVCAALALTLVACSNPAPSPLRETHTITGSITAPYCTDGYNIVHASVEIRDENDKMIGAATTSSDRQDGFGCEAAFSIGAVPKASFYQITIGTHGGPSYSYDEMVAQEWSLALSLYD